MTCCSIGQTGKTKYVELLTGSVAGLVCYYCVHFKDKPGWDDALDIWRVHGMGGVLGTILPGVFASTAIDPNGADGLLYGGTGFFAIQLIVVTAASIYAFVFTYIMLIAIDFITPVKVSEDEEHQGLDMSIHGETAYDINLI